MHCIGAWWLSSATWGQRLSLWGKHPLKCAKCIAFHLLVTIDQCMPDWHLGYVSLHGYGMSALYCQLCLAAWNSTRLSCIIQGYCFASALILASASTLWHPFTLNLPFFFGSRPAMCIGFIELVGLVYMIDFWHHVFFNTHKHFTQMVQVILHTKSVSPKIIYICFTRC